MSLISYTSPVITGHRGFKAKYPENTFRAFTKCYSSGATVIETDLWLTKDNVLVISHDISTKRIFCHQNGEPADYNILHSTYDDIKDLVTIESGERLLTFKDVLKWFVDYIQENESDSHKLMLDIKRYNPAKLIKFLIKELLAVKDDLGWWLHRIQLGIWDLNVLKYLNQDMYFRKLFGVDLNNKLGYRQFDIFHISVSWRDSLHYINYNCYIDSLPQDESLFRFKVTGISLIYISTWSASFLTQFVPLLQAQNLKLYTWTINNYEQFAYFLILSKVIALPECGTITDHPDLMVIHKNLVNDADVELVSEITKLTKQSDSYDCFDCVPVKLPLKQRIFYYIFKVFHAAAGSKRVTEEEKQFDSFVDENKLHPIKINKFFIWLFSTCQKYGIF